MANLNQSQHGSFAILSYCMYLNSQIFGISQYAKLLEKTAKIRRRFEAEIFLRLNVNNSLICIRYAQIYQTFLLFAAIFKMAAFGLDIYVWGPWSPHIAYWFLGLGAYTEVFRTCTGYQQVWGSCSKFVQSMQYHKSGSLFGWAATTFN